MAVIRIWIPEIYDESLIRLHRAELTDTEIADRLQFDPADVTKARRRLGLRPNRRFRAPDGRNENKPSVSFRPDPLQIASQVVPGFNREKMTRHGIPIKTQEVIKLCNQLLKEQGRKQVGPPEHHV